MAKLEMTLNADFNDLLYQIEQGIQSGSISASLEDGSNFCDNDCRCIVRVFERYSMIGGNRVSLNVTMFQKADRSIVLSAIASGGSQAAFLKINTFGEEAFLDKLRDILACYR